MELDWLAHMQSEPLRASCETGECIFSQLSGIKILLVHTYCG